MRDISQLTLGAVRQLASESRPPNWQIDFLLLGCGPALGTVIIWCCVRNGCKSVCASDWRPTNQFSLMFTSTFSWETNPSARWVLVNCATMVMRRSIDDLWLMLDVFSEIRRRSSGRHETTFFTICPLTRSRRVAAHKFNQLLGSYSMFLCFHYLFVCNSRQQVLDRKSPLVLVLHCWWPGLQ